MIPSVVKSFVVGSEVANENFEPVEMCSRIVSSPESVVSSREGPSKMLPYTRASVVAPRAPNAYAVALPSSCVI